MHWIIERHTVVGSTMDAAEERAQRGAPAGVVVVAGEQTHGRGQRGRTWLAPAGTSLLMTIIARPRCRPDELQLIPELVGAHVATVIAEKTGMHCTVKPPNDVLVNGRKLAGILCQSSIEAGNVRHVLVGIGINVNIPCDDLPLDSSTSIMAETDAVYDLNDLLDALLDELEKCWCFTPAFDT
jgi:BirA family transcriptional regulator, biotin operon repressor / biotin---[acetyl-CoA-carboxylase] ligase